MRRLAHWVLFSLAAGLAFLNTPLWGKVEGGWEYGSPIFVIASPVLIVFIATLVAAFRAVAVAMQRRDLAVHMATGLTRGRAVRRSAREGLSVGLRWGGAGVAVGTLARQAVTGLDGTAFDANSLVEGVVILIVVVASAVLAWGAVAAWATRNSAGGTGTGSAASASADAPLPPKRLSRAEHILVVVAGALAAFGLLTTQTDFARNSDSVGPGNVVWEVLAYVGLVVALPAFAFWAAARLGVWLTRSVAPLVIGRTAGGSARGIAGDALARRTPLRGIAVAGVAAVLGVATAVTIISGGTTARKELAEVLTPDAVVSTAHVEFMSDTSQVAAVPEGWAAVAVPDAVVAELAADERLVVVPAGILATELRQTRVQEDGSGGDESRDVYLAVANDDMRSVAPDGLLPLYFGDGVKLTGWLGWDTGLDGFIYADGSGARVASPQLYGPFVTVPRDWASAVFGGGPTSALLVYVTDAERGGAPASYDDVLVAAVLDEHNLQGLIRTVMPREHYDEPTAQYSRNLLLVAGAFLLVAVALVVAMAAASVRLRAREYATLEALGATAATVRKAAAIEAAVTTAVGVLLGVGLGTLAGLLLSPWMAGAPAGTWWWNVGYDIAHTLWWPLAVLGAAGVGLAAVGALAVRAPGSALPAEQLRQAAREGVA